MPLALSLAFDRAGSRRPARMAIIAMTTRSSINVNPSPKLLAIRVEVFALTIPILKANISLFTFFFCFTKFENSQWNSRNRSLKIKRRQQNSRVMSAGVQKEKSVRVQKKTFSKRVIPQDFGPRILGWERRLGHGPELAQRMMNEGDGGSLGWGNGPTAAQKVDLMVGLDPAAQMERQMQVQQGGMAGKDAGPCAAPPRLCAKRHCD